MLKVVLKGHDYEYEVSELIKLFTSEFEYVEELQDSEEKFLVNSIEINGKKVISKTEIYENGSIIGEFTEQKEFKKDYSDLVNNSNNYAEFVEKLEREDSLAVKKAARWSIKKSMFQALKQIMPDSYVPWGDLTGIKPVKIVHNLISDGMDDSQVLNYLKEEHFITDEKAELALDIAKRERGFIYPLSDKKISLYVSIPFCPTRCYYCSFPSNSIQKYGNLRRKYVERLLDEARGTAEIIKNRGWEIETFYIGGGTPTALEAEDMDYMIENLFEIFDFSKIKEFTVEAGRPDTITEEKLRVLKKHGVNRISINPQTMNDSTLEKIGRKHSVEDIKTCFKMARELGFDNINMDIILGLVDEDAEMVKNTLEEIKKLSPESLTVHTLAIKRASKLNMDMDSYKENLTQYKEMIKMIDISMEAAKEMNLNPYYMYRQKMMLGNLENVGYAKEGYECIYNMQMMEEKQTNIAIGAGAVSKFVYLDENRIERVDDVKNLEIYLDRVEDMIEKKKREVEKNAN